jgi:hypothetical protein
LKLAPFATDLSQVFNIANKHVKKKEVSFGWQLQGRVRRITMLQQCSTGT